MTTHGTGTREERLKARRKLDHPLRQAQGRLSRLFAFGRGRLTRKFQSPAARTFVSSGSAAHRWPTQDEGRGAPGATRNLGRQLRNSQRRDRRERAAGKPAAAP
jgi:hypothetical protein